MKIEVDEVDHDTFTKLIVEDLKEAILMQRDFSFDEVETEDNKARLLSSLYDVLRYYTTRKEYEDFLKEVKDAI